ncbi:CHAT domain-containing protein [Pricia sp.]|uniref:CHAT domain-containing protein n=1 Tax=Pricia sp. TaxID=2268138 RepID=UPI0035943AC6
MKFLTLFFGFFLVVFHLTGQSSRYNEKLDSLFEKGYGHLYTDKDSAYYYCNEIMKLAIAEKDWKTVIDALATKNMVADLNSDLDLFQKNLLVLDSLYVVQKTYIDSMPESTIYRNLLLNEKGTYRYLLNDYKRSREAFQKIVEVTEQVPDSLLDADLKHYLSLSYSYLAKMYADENKFDRAKQYYTKNIRYLMAENSSNNQSLLFNNYSLLAEVYKNEGKFDRANKYLLKTLEYNLNNKNGSSVLSILNLVQNQNSLGQKDSATYYLKIAQNLMAADDPELSSYYQVSAETHQKNNNYTEAEKEFNKSLQLVKNRWGDQKPLEVAHVLNKIGLLHEVFDRPQKAVESFDRAIDQLRGLKNAVGQSKLIRILKNKTVALNSLNTSGDYLSTLHTVDEGIKILDNLKPSFQSHSDKLWLIEDAFPMFESGLEAAYELYSSTQDEQFIDKGFLYSEKSKAVLLLEALLESKATQFANIPADLLEREKQVKAQISNLEKQINVAQDDTGTLKDYLFDFREEYRRLVNKIESDYPAYYDLKYNTNTISVAETQRMLGKDEQLISYFYGNDAIYAVAVDKNGQQMERIAIDTTLENKISEIHRLLADPKSDSATLGKATHQSYIKVVAPFLNSGDIKKLIIITDGLLNYIPFAALNTSEYGISYLAESHAIAYTNSATLLSQLRDREQKEPKILAFAPSFNQVTAPSDGTRSGLLPLPNNKKEVEEILNSFNGRSFTGENASLKNFEAQLSGFGMLHLATHAIFDDASPEYSYLAFSHDNDENAEDFLYVSDLYNLQIDANLVTLSACESGIGDLKRGEGFLSLARGFFYSGASSICSTLWKITDASTTQLMDTFYKNLSEGDSKDVALQKAQVRFLNANRQNALAHPYYWSGFVISGNMDPVVKTHGGLWIAFGGICLLLIAFLVYRKRKQGR